MGGRKRTTDFSKGKRLATKDHLMELAKPKKKPDWMQQEHNDRIPNTLTIRENKVSGKKLKTTILSPNEATKYELKVRNKKRWQIEDDFRNIKTTKGMETLSCKTPEMSEKEKWVYLLAYNLIRLLMAQGALLADILPRQLRFKQTLQLWLAWNHPGIFDSTELDEKTLFILIAQRRIGNRSGRIEPRAVKRRQKPFSLLMKQGSR